jgi:3-deoxy-D-manno-octulosonic-acid transferase
VVSTMTASGFKVAKERVPGAAEKIFVPLDLPGAVRRALRRIEPDLLIVAETELWPNLILETKRAGCQVTMINGRISEKSSQRYAWMKSLTADMLQAFDLLAVQTEADARRFVALGAKAPRIKVTGNIKNLGSPQVPGDQLAAELRLKPGTPVWVAGSTRPGEEEIILEAFSRVRAQVPDATLILAPRHLERIGAVEKILRERQLPYVRRTAMFQELLNWPVILLDTLGELAQIYGLGTVAFVGGSLVPQGGHNPLEPAVAGVPVIMGPHHENVTEPMNFLQQAGAAQVAGDAETLAAAVSACLLNPETARARGEQGRRAAASRQSAAGQTVELLQKVMLIRRWGTEVKNWRSEGTTAAGTRAGANDPWLEDWPEWPL